MPEGLGELSGGLVVANPPYGERIGRGDDLPMLYRSLGRRLLEQFSGWQAAILTGHGGLGLELGIKARRSHTIWNGPVECRLLRFELDQGARMIEPVNQLPLALLRRLAAGQSLPVTAEAVANRLRKNSKHAGRLARKEGVTCYRIYDADLPEHAVAVDLYHDEDGKQWLVAQEYAPPPSIPAETARGRLVDTLHALIDVYGVGVEQLFLKRRERQRGRLQYRRFDRSGDYHAVREGKARLWVNFSDHLDTGLFLDHRITRQRLAGLAQGKRFLNLFSYTGAATVQAALGGAATTISVDLSANYLDWLRANLSLNGIDGPAHRCERADVREWLSEQPAASYDLIFLDPPTFSTSKRMEGTLDIQRDHVELIKETMRLLTADGLLLFSTNSRRFQLDEAALGPCLIADISDQTIPPDFARNRRIHQAWEMRWPEGSV